MSRTNSLTNNPERNLFNMDSRDRQIALLNVNTAAATLTAAVLSDEGGPYSVVDAIDRYEAIHEAIWTNFLKHLSTPVTSSAAAPTPESIAAAFDGEVLPNNVVPITQNVQQAQQGLQVVGTQHGPLPDWLFKAASDKGVTKVYDNRFDRDGVDQRGTKRPWFKEAVPKGQEGVAFWPPKGGK